MAFKLAPPKPRRNNNRPPGGRFDRYREPVTNARAAIAAGMAWGEAVRLFRIPPSMQGRV